FDGYFSTLKEEISTLPSSVGEIENFIKTNNVLDFLRDKETRENELANILLANVSNILSKNQQSLMESLSIYINSMTSAINTIPDSLSSLENSVKAANIADYLKEKETRDKENIEKANQSLIQAIENAKNEMAKVSSNNQSLLEQKISELVETIKTTGDNQEEILTQISNNESSLGVIFSENTANLTERYSKDLSDSFDRLIQNLIPVSKMSVQGIMEIRDEIKQNAVKMITEKEKRDRLFVKEAISRWIEAYSKEQSSLFSIISALKTDIEDIRQSMAHVTQGNSWTKLVEFLENYVKGVTLAESKKIQMLMDFREIVSSKILPHLHNISTIAHLQKQGTDTSVQLFNSLSQQNEMMVNSNREMTQMIREASSSITKAFSSIGSLIESQRQSVENINSLSEKLENILVKQIEVFEREEKNLKTLEKESNRSKAMTHNDRGVGFYHTKQFHTAIKEFQKATDLAPELHEPYLNLGIVFAEIGEMEKAKNLFTKVIEMSPETVEAYINLGLLYVYDEKLDQAETLIKESLKFSPNYSRSLSALGEIYFKMKKYDLAEDAWQRAVDVNPLDEEAKRGLKQLRGEDIAE
ncbi:tetratricopeptide repeat protein, partial [candidate division WOR-3 bacterium]|nr:tetratricopeptide repeat protein [candidate division WOR-3 bacterium]